MTPYVVAHVAVSVEGATTGFEPDVGRFYELAGTWNEDVTLAGADTILAQEGVLASSRGPGPDPEGPLLAVVDGRGRVREWEALRNAGHWSDVIAVHCTATPPRPPDRSVEELVAGHDHVDLAGLLRRLELRGGVETIRVDSGGVLIGALLKAGLLTEVSLLVHPRLAGDRATRFWYGCASGSVRSLDLVANQTFDDGLVWLRYRIGG